MTRGIRWLLIGMLGVLILEIVLIFTGSLGRLDADEAVVRLKARHILDGEHPVFFWGQSYGGTGEVYLTAAAFWPGGSSIAILKLIPFMFQCGAAVLLWRIACRFFDDGRAFLAGAALLIFPAYFVIRSTRSYGFYGFLLVVGLAVLLLALRLAEKPDSGPDAAALGLVLGIGWWTSPQVVLIAIPALAWLVVRRPAVARLWWVTIPTFVVGAGPWFHWNLNNDFNSLALEVPGEDNTYWSHLVVFFRNALPMSIGVRLPEDQGWVFGPLGFGVYIGALAAFFLSVRGLSERMTLLVAVAVVYPFLFALSPWTGFTGEPRYLVLLHPILLLLFLSALRTFTAQVVGIGLAAILAVGSIVYLERTYEGPVVSDIAVEVDLPSLVNELEEQGIAHVYADYWIAYPITFASEERVVAASTSHVRYLPYQDAAAADPGAAHIFPIGSPAESEFLASTDNAIGYDITRIDPVVIYRPGSAR
jgi:hypothetical protein